MAIEVPFINYLLPCCLNPTKQQFGYLLKLKKNVEDLSEAMSRLAAKLDDIQPKVAEGERNQEACTREVADWVRRVMDVEQKVKKIQRKYDQHVCLNVWSSYRIGKRAFKMRAKVEKLIEQGSFQAVTAKPPSGGCQEMPCPTPVLGMDSYLQQALRYIGDDGVGIVGICGMGGVGKTTLLRKINNTFLPGGGRNNEFDYVIWAVASRDFSLQRLQERIFKWLDLKLPDSAESYSQIIFNFLSNRSFLLLLDDLWSGVNLDEVGIPEAACAAGGIKRKLVLTTRDVSVCGRMGASGAMIRIECLGWEDAWRLFQEKAGASIINSDPRIPPLARQVAEECDGLPLALTIVGRAMSIKTDARDWKFAVDSLRRSRILELPGAQGDNKKLLNILKLSYEYLPSEEIRRCFLLCSLWPEDYSIDRGELIQCWMGIGVIGGSDDFEFRCNKYQSFISSLKEACLLEPGLNKEREVKMHDIIRDLALEIANEESEGMWIVRAGVGLRAAPRRMEQAKVISLMRNDIQALPEPLPEFPNLSTLVLQGNHDLHAIPANIHQSLVALTYLDLSHTAVQELPSAISEIRKLQYLNLSFTQIRSLPMELKYLVNLKHLLLSYTCLSVIPSGVISSLAELEELDLYESHYAGWEVMEGEGDRGATFEELEKNQNLKSLGITIKAVPTLAKLLQSSHVSTRRLRIKRLSCQNLATPVQLTPQIIPPHICESLEEFIVSDLTGSRQLSLENHGGQSWCLENLEILNIGNLWDLEAIIWKGVVAQEFLRNVRELSIIGCLKLKNASWILHLPKLEIVDLSFCKELTHIIDDLEDGQGGTNLAEESVRTFPRLNKFVLKSLPNLRSIAGHPLAFPSLEYIQVHHCDKLKKLPFQTQITDSLREIRGSENWWEGLEWDSDSIKSSLQSYFRIRK